MQKFNIDIRQYEWTLHVFIDDGSLDPDEITETMWLLGCTGEPLADARESLWRNEVDTGFTWSNFRKRATVMVLAKASEPRQFYNSCVHESQHLISHLAQALGINPWSERMAYLAGDTAMALFPHIKHYLCDCRKSKRRV